MELLPPLASPPTPGSPLLPPGPNGSQKGTGPGQCGTCRMLPGTEQGRQHRAGETPRVAVEGYAGDGSTFHPLLPVGRDHQLHLQRRIV